MNAVGFNLTAFIFNIQFQLRSFARAMGADPTTSPVTGEYSTVELRPQFDESFEYNSLSTKKKCRISKMYMIIHKIV